MNLTVWKAYFTSAGDPVNAEYATNGLEFPTRDEAILYAQNLYSRWLGARSFGVAQVITGDTSRRPASDLDIIR